MGLPVVQTQIPEQERRKKERKKEREKSMIIVVPSCLKDADGARTRSDQKSVSSHKINLTKHFDSQPDADL